MYIGENSPSHAQHGPLTGDNLCTSWVATQLSWENNIHLLWIKVFWNYFSAATSSEN